MIADIENGRIVDRNVETINEPFPPRRASMLSERDVNTLICGALSRPMKALVQGVSVEVIPFVSGGVDEILQAYLEGGLGQDRFKMPGCCGRSRKGRFRNRKGRGSGKRKMR